MQARENPQIPSLLPWLRIRYGWKIEKTDKTDKKDFSLSQISCILERNRFEPEDGEETFYSKMIMNVGGSYA